MLGKKFGLAIVAFGVLTGAAQACYKPVNDRGLAQEALVLVNAERRAMGLHDLTYDSTLGEVADRQSCWMADSRQMSHKGPKGGDVGRRAKKAGYKYRHVSENVAMGFNTAAAVVKAWMNSPGHRRNILNTQPTEAAVSARADADGKVYWTLFFGKPK